MTYQKKKDLSILKQRRKLKYSISEMVHNDMCSSHQAAVLFDPNKGHII